MYNDIQHVGIISTRTGISFKVPRVQNSSWDLIYNMHGFIQDFYLGGDMWVV